MYAFFFAVIVAVTSAANRQQVLQAEDAVVGSDVSFTVKAIPPKASSPARYKLKISSNGGFALTSKPIGLDILGKTVAAGTFTGSCHTVQ
jgi:hypothetical protein